MKVNQRGFSPLMLIACVLVVAGIAAAGWYVRSSRVTKGSPVTAAAAIDTVKGTKIQANTYYAVNFKGSGQYDGKVTPVNPTYFRLSPVYYYDGTGAFVQLGQELHAPEAAMYVNSSSVTAFKQLSAGDAQYKGIQTLKQADGEPAVQDALPNISIDAYIKHGQYQAVFFVDGKVYFGKLRSAASDPVFDDPTQVFELSTASGQPSLVNVKSTLISTYGHSMIAYWENLKNDGQVAKAINTYLQQNP